MLTTQLESGVRLLGTGSVSKDHHARWELVTRHQLVKAFGRGSPNILAVVDAGVRSVCPIGADRAWWEAYRVERLTSQMRELAGMLRLLGSEPTCRIPTPKALPKPAEPRPRPARPEPKSAPPSPPRPSIQPVEEKKVAPPPGSEPEPGPEEHSLPDAATATVVEPAEPEPDASNPADVFSGWKSDAPPVIRRKTAAAPPPPVAPAQTGPVEYFTGVACVNGHPATGAAEAYPARATPRCKTCGAGTLRSCRECGVAVRGGQYSMRLDDRAEPPWTVPNYCHSCGGAFPWTRLKLEALEATIGELLELDEAEREGLVALVPDTIAETPKTAVAVMRWQRALAKLQPQGRSLVSDVLKQAAGALFSQHLGLAP